MNPSLLKPTTNSTTAAGRKQEPLSTNTKEQYN
jgi:hypothetical protein